MGWQWQVPLEEQGAKVLLGPAETFCGLPLRFLRSSASPPLSIGDFNRDAGWPRDLHRRLHVRL